MLARMPTQDATRAARYMNVSAQTRGRRPSASPYRWPLPTVMPPASASRHVTARGGPATMVAASCARFTNGGRAGDTGDSKLGKWTSWPLARPPVCCWHAAQQFLSPAGADRCDTGGRVHPLDGAGDAPHGPRERRRRGSVARSRRRDGTELPAAAPNSRPALATA